MRPSGKASAVRRPSILVRRSASRIQLGRAESRGTRPPTAGSRPRSTVRLRQPVRHRSSTGTRPAGGWPGLSSESRRKRPRGNGRGRSHFVDWWVFSDENQTVFPVDPRRDQEAVPLTLDSESEELLVSDCLRTYAEATPNKQKSTLAI